MSLAFRIAGILPLFIAYALYETANGNKPGLNGICGGLCVAGGLLFVASAISELSENVRALGHQNQGERST